MHVIRKLAIVSMTIIALLAMWTLPAFAKTATPATTAKPATTVPLCAIHTPPPFVEAGFGTTHSSVAGTFVVECRPVFSEDRVTITADELYFRCRGLLSWSTPPPMTTGTGESFDVFLDDNGGAIASFWGGPSCAAGTSTICAHLDAPPYTTVCSYFTVLSPRNTPAGVRAIPSTEVEDSIYSSVETVIYVEFPAVYSEQYVKIDAQELYSRCAGGISWIGPDETPGTPATGPFTYVTLDNNGNAFVTAEAGPSCAAGTSTIEASLTIAPFTTYLTHFTILSPRDTCTATAC